MCSAYEIGQFNGNVPITIGGDDFDSLKSAGSTSLIRRTDSAPVYLVDGGMTTMRWGYERPGLGVVNNTRSENLDSRMWRESFSSRRCLIPVRAFYEWSGSKGHKRTHRFTRPDGRLLWVAGIWEESEDLGRCYSMLTTAANSVVAPIHHRMPSVLSEGELVQYLEGGLSRFAPGPSALCVNDAPNPLLRNPPTDGQGELF